MTSAEISAQTFCQVRHTRPHNMPHNCFCIAPSRGKTETEIERWRGLCLCLISLSVRSVSHYWGSLYARAVGRSGHWPLGGSGSCCPSRILWTIILTTASKYVPTSRTQGAEVHCSATAV